jgi:hypothetical protein
MTVSFPCLPRRAVALRGWRPPVAAQWAALWALLCATLAMPAYALEFGTLRLYLPPGQPPYAEITLSDKAPLDPADIRARVATPDAYGVAGMRYVPALQNVLITPQAGANGEVLLRLDRLPAPGDSPEVDLLLLVGDRMSLALGEYRLNLLGSSREFAAAPPGTRLAATAAAPSQPPRGVSSSPVSSSPPTALTTTPLPSAAVSQAAALEAAYPAVAEAIEAWARAWSRRDVDAYVAAYTPDYAGPGRNASRAAWIQQRRSRIAPRRSISVEVSGLQFSSRDNNVVATFDQLYQGDALTERSRKRLVLTLVGQRWLIQEEREL